MNDPESHDELKARVLDALDADIRRLRTDQVMRDAQHVQIPEPERHPARRKWLAQSLLTKAGDVAFVVVLVLAGLGGLGLSCGVLVRGFRWGSGL